MENRKYNTRSIVEAGLISAIIIVLMIITGYVPMISFMGTLILPVPVAVLYIRHNFKVTLTAIIVSTIITAAIFNPIQALLSAISFGLTGLTLGYSIRKNKNSTYILLLLAVVSLIVTVATTFLTIALIEKTSFVQFFTKSINDLSEAMKQSVDMAKDLYSKAGMTKEQLAQFDAIAGFLNVDFILNALAAILIIQAVFSAFLNYVTAKAILKRLGYSLDRIRRFTELYINSFVGAIIVLPVPLAIFLQAKGVPIGKPILVSGQIIMQYVFLIIGISVATYFLKRRFNLQNLLIVLIVIFTSFSPIFATIYLYIGLADMLFDFRKINPNRILRR